MSKSKGMQLGANRVPAAVLAEQWAEESSSNDNPWGNDDLIDINADQDDWSSFEIAPPVVAPKPVSAITPAFNGLSLNPPTAPAQHTKPSPISRTTDDWGSPDEWDNSEQKRAVSPPKTTTTNMTKEEKASEMARRKEERKQRIAMLKEQKKNASQS